ncbi:MAG: ATP-binding protein [bacterium]|nr:ATP-binding protein [bacterium]
MGAGWVHPTNQNGTPVYGKLVACVAKDCLADSRKHYQQTNRYLEIRGVTERLQTFEKFIPRPGTKPAFDAFRNLAEGKTDKPLILCCGTTGCGKTHLCQALTTMLNKRGVETYYYVVSALLDILHSAVEQNDVEQWIKFLTAVPGLVLDDFGADKHSDWSIGKLQDIIDARWTKKLVTVMTTNKDLIGTAGDPGLQMISPRIYSRMCDQELSVVILNKASDYRTERRSK